MRDVGARAKPAGRHVDTGSMPNAVANRSRCKFPAPVRGGVHLALADVGADVEESQLARHNATHASTGKGVDDNRRRGALLRPRRVPRQRAFSKDGVKNACASKAGRQCRQSFTEEIVVAPLATVDAERKPLALASLPVARLGVEYGDADPGAAIFALRPICCRSMGSGNVLRVWSVILAG